MQFPICFPLLNRQMPDLYEQILELISQGDDCITQYVPTPRRTHSPPVARVTAEKVDSMKFADWRASSQHFIVIHFGDSCPFLEKFNTAVTYEHADMVRRGIGVLQSFARAVAEETISPVSEVPAVAKPTAVQKVLHIFDRFHTVALSLRNRRSRRAPIEIKDEYDVQYVMEALLKLDFDDVRPEEVTPSSGGKSARTDFLLFNEKIVVECKWERGQKIRDELVIDMKTYKTHPRCEVLVCFVYDPGHVNKNPSAIESMSDAENFIRVRPTR